MQVISIICLALLAIAFAFSGITEKESTLGSRVTYAIFIAMTLIPLIYIVTEGS